uniref:Uncharacterized protein n=1 Tax=Medicago truncatula TaxID=3880 RepID=B7FFP3_MEDTR|nr:unknown [Medicago truncatula]
MTKFPYFKTPLIFVSVAQVPSQYQHLEMEFQSWCYFFQEEALLSLSYQIILSSNLQGHHQRMSSQALQTSLQDHHLSTDPELQLGTPLSSLSLPFFQKRKGRHLY